jgi:hypothetical protein
MCGFHVGGKGWNGREREISTELPSFLLLFLMGHCLLFRATTNEVCRGLCRAENERAQRICLRDRCAVDKEERGKRKEEKGTKTRLIWQGSGDWEYPQRRVKMCM